MKKLQLVESVSVALILVSYLIPFVSVKIIERQEISILTMATDSGYEQFFNLGAYSFLPILFGIIVIVVNSAKYPVIPFLTGLSVVLAIAPITGSRLYESAGEPSVGLVLMAFGGGMLFFSSLLNTSWNYKRHRIFLICLVTLLLLPAIITFIYAGALGVIVLFGAISLFPIMGATMLLSFLVNRKRKPIATAAVLQEQSQPIASNENPNPTNTEAPKVEEPTADVPESNPAPTGEGANCIAGLMKKCKSKKVLMAGVAILAALVVGIVVCTNFSNTPASEVDYTLTPISDESGLYGFKDKNDQNVIPKQFKKVELFRCGLALVAVDDQETGVRKYGFIDKKGKFVINPKYIRASSFSQDIAWVVQENGAPQAIDKKGNPLFELKDALAVWPFSDGLARFSQQGKASGETLYGFVDKSGKVAISPQYNHARNFNNGMAAVADKNRKAGFIDKKGKLLIPFEFEYSRYGEDNIFNENGHAVVRKDDKFGVIDKTGRYVITPQYGYIASDGDIFMIYDDNRKIGWCDKSGRVIIQPQFGLAKPFNGQKLAPVGTEESGYGYVNRDGEMVIHAQFDDAYSFEQDGMALIVLNDSPHYIDL